ncbi:Protein of unknown function [Propionibacterium freudenreichii]|nr:Protein of unknown function [Propionibacterium freudenreichii]
MFAAGEIGVGPAEI